MEREFKICLTAGPTGFNLLGILGNVNGLSLAAFVLLHIISIKNFGTMQYMNIYFNTISRQAHTTVSICLDI